MKAYGLEIAQQPFTAAAKAVLLAVMMLLLPYCTSGYQCTLPGSSACAFHIALSHF